MVAATTRVAVIGANSFSGAHLIDLLLEDPSMQVLGLSRSPPYPPFLLAYSHHRDPAFTFKQGDMVAAPERLLADLDAFRPDYIVNFAAQGEVRSSFDHPDHHYRTNALGIVTLAQGLKDRDYLKRYVQISTPEVYGTCAGRITEDAPFNPSSPYAASKASGDLFLMSLHKTFGFPVVFIRATNVYGPFQQLYRIIPRTVIYLRQGRRIPLHGGGAAVKSYIHIRDVSEGERAAMLQGQPGEVYHLSPDEGIAVADVVRLICERMGRSFEDSVERVGERLGQDAAYVIDSSKARAAFGWRPRLSMSEGLGQVVTWIETHFDDIVRQPLDYVHIPS